MNQFDEFSKHMAQKRSRRSLFKFLGGGFVIAAISGIGSGAATADSGPEATGLPYFNSTFPKVPYFNQNQSFKDALLEYLIKRSKLH